MNHFAKYEFETAYKLEASNFRAKFLSRYAKQVDTLDDALDAEDLVLKAEEVPADLGSFLDLCLEETERYVTNWRRKTAKKAQKYLKIFFIWDAQLL